MNIAEAVEKYRNRVVISDREQHTPADVLAQAYLDLTDQTPLTREVIEKELGPVDKYGRWTARNGCYISWSSVWNHAICGGLFFTTLGHLRQIVAMLRGGGK